MISYVTGPLGFGKSVYAARVMGKAFLHGKVVASNVQLVPDWAEIVAKHFPSAKLKKDEQKKIADILQERYLYEPDVLELSRTFIRGWGEERGVMVIDESHLRLNNRMWDDAEQKKVLDELTHVRKRGWHTYIVAQHGDNTDVAIRRIAGEEIRLINWRKLLRAPLLGTPLLPVPLFLAMGYTLNAGQVRSANKANWRELFMLGWTANLFDTFQEFVDAAYAPDQRVYLPSTPDERFKAKANRRGIAAGTAAQTPPGGARRTAAPAAKLSPNSEVSVP